MSALQVVGIIIGTLAALWFAKRLLARLAGRVVETHVARNGLCERCAIAKRVYILRSDTGPSFSLCDTCVPPLPPKAWLLERGKLVRVDS